jgi:hypothetical protein
VGRPLWDALCEKGRPLALLCLAATSHCCERAAASKSQHGDDAKEEPGHTSDSRHDESALRHHGAPNIIWSAGGSAHVRAPNVWACVWARSATGVGSLLSIDVQPRRECEANGESVEQPTIQESTAECASRARLIASQDTCR